MPHMATEWIEIENINQLNHHHYSTDVDFVVVAWPRGVGEAFSKVNKSAPADLLLLFGPRSYPWNTRK